MSWTSALAESLARLRHALPPTITSAFTTPPPSLIRCISPASLLTQPSPWLLNRSRPSSATSPLSPLVRKLALSPASPRRLLGRARLWTAPASARVLPGTLPSSFVSFPLASYLYPRLTKVCVTELHPGDVPDADVVDDGVQPAAAVLPVRRQCPSLASSSLYLDLIFFSSPSVEHALHRLRTRLHQSRLRPDRDRRVLRYPFRHSRRCIDDGRRRRLEPYLDWLLHHR